MSEIKNIGIIMDGNGRWARQKFRPRVWGHIKGTQTINPIVKKAKELELSERFNELSEIIPLAILTGKLEEVRDYIVKNVSNILDENNKNINTCYVTNNK